MIKTTINIPADIKEDIETLKKELGLKTASAVIIEAMKNLKEDFLARKEQKRWEKSVEIASKDPAILSLEQELSNEGVEFA